MAEEEFQTQQQQCHRQHVVTPSTHSHSHSHTLPGADRADRADRQTPTLRSPPEPVDPCASISQESSKPVPPAGLGRIRLPSAQHYPVHTLSFYAHRHQLSDPSHSLAFLSLQLLGLDGGCEAKGRSGRRGEEEVGRLLVLLASAQPNLTHCPMLVPFLCVSLLFLPSSLTFALSLLLITRPLSSAGACPALPLTTPEFQTVITLFETYAFRHAPAVSAHLKNILNLRFLMMMVIV